MARPVPHCLRVSIPNLLPAPRLNRLPLHLIRHAQQVARAIQTVPKLLARQDHQRVIAHHFIRDEVMNPVPTLDLPERGCEILLHHQRIRDAVADLRCDFERAIRTDLQRSYLEFSV